MQGNDIMQAIELSEIKSPNGEPKVLFSKENGEALNIEKKNLLEPLNKITRVDSYKGSAKANDAEVSAESESERMRWSNHFEYVLSVVGFVIDLGNVNIYSL